MRSLALAKRLDEKKRGGPEIRTHSSPRKKSPRPLVFTSVGVSTSSFPRLTPFVVSRKCKVCNKIYIYIDIKRKKIACACVRIKNVCQCGVGVSCVLWYVEISTK